MLDENNESRAKQSSQKDFSHLAQVVSVTAMQTEQIMVDGGATFPSADH